MSTLPLVHERHWERVSRDFDDVGPLACVDEIVAELRAENPEYLAIARRAAADADDPACALTGFAKFYRILSLEACDRGSAVPRISRQTLDVVRTLMGEIGEEHFIVLASRAMCEENPCLGQMADSFASRRRDYMNLMQGFVLLYKCLSAQAANDNLEARFGAATA